MPFPALASRNRIHNIIESQDKNRHLLLLPFVTKTNFSGRFEEHPSFGFAKRGHVGPRCRMGHGSKS